MVPKPKRNTRDVVNQPKQISDSTSSVSKKRNASSATVTSSSLSSSSKKQKLANNSSSSNSSIGSIREFDADNSSTTIGGLLRNMQGKRTSTPISTNGRKDLDHHKQSEVAGAGKFVRDIDDDNNFNVDGDTQFGGGDDNNNNFEEDENVDGSDLDDDEDENDDREADENLENVDFEENTKWVEESTFDNKKLLDEFMQKENCWSYRGCCNTAMGEKVLYRCNRVKRTSRIQCDAAIYVIEKVVYVTVRDASADGGEATTTKSIFILYRKSAEHTHDQSPDVVIPKVKDYVKNEIMKQFKDGRKPKKIFYNLLENEDIPLADKPLHKQVVSVVKAFKRENFGEAPITMRQLSNFVEKHCELPTNVDEPFIVRFEKSPRNVKENKFFRMFISTARLLSTASKSTILHADATHKVTTEKIPLLAVGVTDAINKFHFTGITLSNHEAAEDYALTFSALRSGVRMVTGTQIQPTSLVCDADAAIHNAFKMVFYGGTSNGNVVPNTNSDDDEDGEVSLSPPTRYIIIMCYFHVILNIRTKYKFQHQSNRTVFKDDVYILHLCDTEQKFSIGCELFVKKWRTVEPEATRLLHNSFFKKNKNWFIGCGYRIPKHNNGLENFNGTMKRCQTEHQRQPLKQFLTTALSIVRQRSLEYLKGKEPFQSEIIIDSELMKLGCELDLKFVYDEEKPDGSIEMFTFRSEMQDNNISLGVVRDFYNAKYKSFADFSANAFNIWKITFPKDSNQWKQSICTCPSFDTYFICKHIISIANTMGLIANDTIVDADYDDEPIFQSKRGRPKKASKALVLD